MNSLLNAKEDEKARKKNAKSNNRTPPSIRSKFPHKKKFDWSQCDPRLMRDAIAAISSSGSAILLGATSDGGAGVAHIYTDGLADKNYVSSVEEANDLMEVLCEFYAIETSSAEDEGIETAP